MFVFRFLYSFLDVWLFYLLFLSFIYFAQDPYLYLKIVILYKYVIMLLLFI